MKDIQKELERKTIQLKELEELKEEAKEILRKIGVLDLSMALQYWMIKNEKNEVSLKEILKLEKEALNKK